MNKFMYLFVSWLFLFSGICSYGSDFHSPRTAALGGAGHAGPLLNDAIYLNPSAISFIPAYGVAFWYQKFAATEDEPDKSFRGKMYSVSIQDGRNETFHAGAGFTQKEDARLVHVAASHTLIKSVSLGGGLKFVFPQDQWGHSRQDLFMSMTWVQGTSAQFALVLDNLLQTEQIKSRGLRREIIAASKFRPHSTIMLYADPKYSFEAPFGRNMGFAAGAEVSAMSDLFFRGGYFRNEMIPAQSTYGNGWGAGIGWLSPKMSLDYGFQKTLEPRISTSHTLGVNVYL